MDDKYGYNFEMYIKENKEMHMGAINDNFDCVPYKSKKENNIHEIVALYRIDEITYEEKAPRKEALENVISSMYIEGINFVYIIKGDENGVHFYFGVSRDSSLDKEMELKNYQNILKSSLQGNFRGSKVTDIGGDDVVKICNEISNMEYAKFLEGVPGINKDDESFQSVDRIVDVMLGEKFALVLIAKPIMSDAIHEIESKIYELYNGIYPLSKTPVQTSESKNESSRKIESKVDSNVKENSESEVTENIARIIKDSKHSNTEKIKKQTEKEIERETYEKGGEETSNKNTNILNSKKSNMETSTSETKETIDSKVTTKITDSVKKEVQDWVEYIEKIILPRIDYGLGKGMFLTSAVLVGEDSASQITLENTIRSIYGGETDNKVPFKAYDLSEEEKEYIKEMQIPILERKMNKEDKLYDVELDVRTAYAQFFRDEEHLFKGNWMSTKELSLYAGLPQKEIVGLSLREEVDFGLNIDNKMVTETNDSKTDGKDIKIGYLVQSGKVFNGENGNPKIEVNFNEKHFDKHIFVTGVTGSGKTTTCQRLLLESGQNFMVIEPAKTEYRVLQNDIEDLLVFTLGNEGVAPFRINPFEFFEGENITSRVDMIKASMEAAFDMEAAIPQLLETAIYECYKKKGWDIYSNRNTKYSNPYAPGVKSFPTFGDLFNIIDDVVRKQGFDGRLESDYIGSIKARIGGLIVGSKGFMLNTPRSINFIELLDKKVVLELEDIKNASEKSLIMGFILTNLSEAIKKKYINDDRTNIKHITLVEEAHRLLSKYMPGDSLNKKQGVEMFSDMLAEVRKYGESLIIADQIPNKVTPEVLKNTNTKIVHKIFAEDDKEAIGNTMALKSEQKEFLSYLETGRAIMLSPGMSKAVQINVLKDEENDTERPTREDSECRESILKYYSDNYEAGVLRGLKNFESQPKIEEVGFCLKYLQADTIFDLYKDSIQHEKINDYMIDILKEIQNNKKLDLLIDVICDTCYKSETVEKYGLHSLIKTYINDILCLGQEFKFYPTSKMDKLSSFSRN